MAASESCWLCHRGMEERFRARDYRRPHSAVKYVVVWCRECDLGRVSGSFSPDDVRLFFDVPYYTRGTSPRPRKPTFWGRAIAHMAWRFDSGVSLSPEECGARAGQTLCDIGCGDGELLRAFKQAGLNIAGVEPDPIARGLASRIGPVFDGTAEHLPSEVSGRRFDVVLMSHVLDACLDVNKALENVRLILKPGGKLVVEVPNCAATGFNLHGPEWPWADIPRHLTFFTEGSLSRTLEKFGFWIERVRYVGYMRQFSPSWAAAQADTHRIIASHPKRRPSLVWLAQTALAADDRKYDSLRIVALRPQELN